MDQKGFTLLEVLVTMVVLTVGLLTLAHMQVAAMTGNLSANNMTIASTLAQDKLEELKGLSLDEADLADTNEENNNTMTTLGVETDAPDHEDAENPLDSGGGTTGARRYARVWNVADDTPVTGTKTIVVIVMWGAVDEDTTFPSHRVTLSSVVGE